MIEPRTINTLEEVRELCKVQLEAATPCSGDYLDGKSLEEGAKILQERYTTQSMDFRPLSYYIEEVAKKVEEWKKHKGERTVFVMQRDVKDGGPITTVFRDWESELDKYIGYYYYYTTEGGAIPIFCTASYLEHMKGKRV